MQKQMQRGSKLGRGVAVCFWIGVILICFIYRDELTVERIVTFAPDNTLLAMLVMLALFTLKGCTMFLNGNIMYMACGVMFPLPLAIAVNLLGSAIMTTVPFWIGRRGGASMLEKLTRKYKKLDLLRDAPKENEFLFTLCLRILGILPSEPVSMYLGACNLRYIPYIAGTLLGLIPVVNAYTVMGAYAADPASPQFIAAAVFRIIATLCMLILAGIWNQKKKENPFHGENKG